MKVYLLHSSYDDGQCYESQSWDYLDKIVDSEEKAKKWIFEQAIEKCKKLANNVSVRWKRTTKEVTTWNVKPRSH